MYLHVKSVAAILLLAMLATGTGSVLVLGFLVASFSFAVILFVMARKMIRRITDARRARPRLSSQLHAVNSRRNNENQRVAA